MKKPSQKFEHGEDFQLYLSVLEDTTSIVLVQEIPDQRLIYFISLVPQDVKMRYLLIEKVVFSLVHAANCLRLYFQSNQIVVKSNYLI